MSDLVPQGPAAEVDVTALTLTRMPGQSVQIEGPCRIVMVRTEGRRASFRILAAPQVKIRRSETIPADDLIGYDRDQPEEQMRLEAGIPADRAPRPATRSKAFRAAGIVVPKRQLG